MYFDFNLYEAYCFKAPGLGVLWFSILFVVGSFRFLILALKKELVRKHILCFLISIPFLGSLLYIDGGVLLHGGVHLLYEKEADAVGMQGEISNIRELNWLSFPRIESNYGYDEANGYEFTINDIQCTAIVKGSLEVGDYVTIKYLPKSRYVLYIADIDADIKEKN